MQSMADNSSKVLAEDVHFALFCYHADILNQFFEMMC